MRADAPDPIELPADVWDRDDVLDMCRRRDAGGLLGLANSSRYRISQTRLAYRIGTEPGAVNKLINGKSGQVVRLDKWERIAEALNMPAHARMALGLSPGSVHSSRDISPHVHERVQHESTPGATDDDMNRREVLRLIAISGSLVAAAGVEHSLSNDLGDGPPAADLEALDSHAVLNAHLWQVFTLSRSKALTFSLVRDQLQVLTDAFDATGRRSDHERLCLLLGDLFQLAGEVLFDLNRYADASNCYVLAATASKEAGAYDLWSCALIRHSFVSIFDGDHRSAPPLLDSASRLARNGDSALSTKYWADVVRAQALAGLGDLDGCRRALDGAEGVLGMTGEIHNGGWLRFDGSRLAEERGRCFVQLGRPDLAETALTDALNQTLSARRKGGVLIDLAMLGVQRRDNSRIAMYGNAAVSLAEQTRSGVLLRKLGDLDAKLAASSQSRHVGDLRDRIAALRQP